MSLNYQIFELKVKISVLLILLGIIMTIDFTLKALDLSSTGLSQRLTTLPSQQVSVILVADAVIRLIPFIFAFISLVLKDSWDSRMNFVLGVIFTISSLFGLITLLFQLTTSTAYEFVIQVVAITAPILIYWYANIWRKIMIK